MPNARIKPGETAEQARVRYNAEARAYRQHRNAIGWKLAERTPEEVFCHDLWKRYRLRLPEYNAMRVAQGNACFICSTPFADKNTQSGASGNCVVDHCHTTGKVRGLLCPSCNLGLGKFKDNPDLLATAISYLNR